MVRPRCPALTHRRAAVSYLWVTIPICEVHMPIKASAFGPSVAGIGAGISDSRGWQGVRRQLECERLG